MVYNESNHANIPHGDPLIPYGAADASYMKYQLSCTLQMGAHFTKEHMTKNAVVVFNFLAVSTEKPDCEKIIFAIKTP